MQDTGADLAKACCPTLLRNVLTKGLSYYITSNSSAKCKMSGKAHSTLTSHTQGPPGTAFSVHSLGIPLSLGTILSTWSIVAVAGKLPRFHVLSPLMGMFWSNWSKSPDKLSSLLVGVVGPHLPIIRIGAAVVSSLTTFTFFIIAGALNSCLPPPTRRNTQISQPDHPFVPYYKQTGLIEYIQDNIWVAQQPLVWHGQQFATRMTVIRIDKNDDELLVYSPIHLTDEIKRSIDSLGRVAYLVAPNCLHHLFVKEWTAQYPNCRVFAGEELLQRRLDLAALPHLTRLGKPEEFYHPNRLLSDTKDIEYVIFNGHAVLNEIVLFHRPSATLILSDMIENFSSLDMPWKSRLSLSVILMLDRPAPPNDWKLSVRDKEAIRNTILAILSWNFNRIIIAHGRLIEKDARQIFQDAFAFVM